jgi:hypothetical protein
MRATFKENSMSKGSMVALLLGLASGGMAMLVGAPHLATAQGTTATPVVYQIQPAVGLALPGTAAVWRLNTSTGALDFCTFENVSAAGANRIACKGNPATPPPR